MVERLTESENLDYSYRNASAGRMRAADHEGYNVAINDTPTAKSATHAPSLARGANGT